MPIRAVFFDFGGVLYLLPDTRWVRRWESILGIQNNPIFSDMLAAPDDSELVRDIMVGRLTETEAWNAVAKDWHIRPALLQKIRWGMMSRKRLNVVMARFLEDLHPRYQTAILSNAGTDARRWFTEVYGLDRMTDAIIISAEEQIAKPDPRIYLAAAARLGVLPEESLFVDDLLPNVDAARAVGMAAVHFQNNAQAIADMRQYLGLI